MPVQPSLALSQLLVAPAIVIPPLNNYMTSYNKSLKDMDEDQMAQEAQVDPTNQIQPLSQGGLQEGKRTTKGEE